MRASADSSLSNFDLERTKAADGKRQKRVFKTVGSGAAIRVTALRASYSNAAGKPRHSAALSSTQRIQTANFERAAAIC